MTRQELDEYCGSINKTSDDMSLEEYFIKIEKKKKEYYNDTIQRPESR